ncbi:acyl carrier protein [Streptomyces solincola]|uniref:acyl carrier protein n=1 Tax=Streptomyces solincola TaxID=2100817 RepID=UPI0015E2C669|nr:acyl carrier protein [Streptomyces solincola]
MHEHTEKQSPDPSRIRADVLDCVQSNLAVLADAFHGEGTHLGLGAELSSRWYPGADDLPTVDPPLAAGLAAAERTLHLAVRGQASSQGPRLPVDIPPGKLRYAVADAHEMPWLPYFGRQHMAHSFLLAAPEAPGGTWSVIDAYDNDTQWGAAKPGSWAVTAEELAGLTRVELFDIVPGPGPAPRPRTRVEHLPMDDYLAAFDAGADRERVLHRLTGDVWLLARSRRLHALFRADGTPDRETAEHLGHWDKLVTQSYLAYRRVTRDRPEPAGIVPQLAALLETDRRIFKETAAAGDPRAGTMPGAGGDQDRAGDALRCEVAAVVGDVLDADAAALLADGTDLAVLPGFTSFRMADVIDRLEARLGVEFDAGDLVPENLRSVDGLCRIVRRATSARRP